MVGYIQKYKDWVGSIQKLMLEVGYKEKDLSIAYNYRGCYFYDNPPDPKTILDRIVRKFGYGIIPDEKVEIYFQKSGLTKTRLNVA